jgi:acylpyruvate hydrolase
MSKTLPLSDFVNVNAINFELHINGTVVQQGFTGDMIFNVNQIIAEASKFFMFKIGDVVFTGTPKGVGKLNIGDRLEAYIEGKKMMDFCIK